VIDLDRLGGLRAVDEGDRRTGVRVDQDTALGIASARPEGEVGQVATQDVVAGVATALALSWPDVPAGGADDGAFGWSRKCSHSATAPQSQADRSHRE
jgi:hypothetical protein